jgi:hypothetical protein
MFVYNIKEVMIMLKDRGTIKWTSLMLPEHVEQLKKLWDDDKLMHKPLLDDQELEEMSCECVHAYDHDLTVEIIVHAEGKSGSLLGKITKIDQQYQQLSIKTNETIEKVPFANIVQLKTTS